MSFDSPQKVEDFVSSLAQQRTYAAALREGNRKTAATICHLRLSCSSMVEHGASNAKIMGSIPRESKS